VAGKYFKIACWVVASMGWVLPTLAADQTLKITHLSGNAFIGATVNGPWEDVKVGLYVAVGRFIKTMPDSYLEFTLPDHSVIRLAPETIFEIETAQFNAKQPRHFLATLYLGKMWANVIWRIGNSNDSFKTCTSTMVAGVRGTVYDLRTAADRSTDIWVYDGLMAINPPIVKESAAHEEIEWPRQVSESEWEEIILGKLQRLHIGPEGIPEKPISFDPYKEKDDWAAWNLERDTANN